MISEYTSKLVGSVAVVIGLTGCTGYSSAPSVENRNNLGIKNGTKYRREINNKQTVR